MRTWTPLRLLSVILMLGTCHQASHGDTLVYGFDDGTFDGWELLGAEGDPFPDDSNVSWISTDEEIDIGDGFSLLPATSGEFRIVPEPWSNRDCQGECYTQILRSPVFFLDGSGDLSVDMIGGGALSNQPFDPDQKDPPESAFDFEVMKQGAELGLQGFAVRDAETGAYVLHGFSIGENDGKARETDPEHREFWDTVTLTQDELAPYANNGRSYQIDVFDSYQGGWGWIGFDTVTIPGSVNAGSPGDFNGDGVLAVEDIESLSAEVRNGTNSANFDLNSDGQVDAEDRRIWIEESASTWLGDANLDGEFNTSDFVSVFQTGQYEDSVAGNSTWAEGDWNGDADFDSGDFVAAFQGGGFEMGPRPEAAAVPEPASLVLMIASLIPLVWFRRRS